MLETRHFSTTPTARSLASRARWKLSGNSPKTVCNLCYATLLYINADKIAESARRPGTPYYDPQSTKEKPRWSLVHVEFRKKFAVPITLKELRELGKPGGPLENMQMLKQSRLSVSRVGADEWKALCNIADEKAEDAGLKHETGKAKK